MGLTERIIMVMTATPDKKWTPRAMAKVLDEDRREVYGRMRRSLKIENLGDGTYRLSPSFCAEVRV